MAMYDSDLYDSPDTTTTMEFEWGKDWEYMVEATINWKYEGNDGIGRYECHGYIGYDSGSPVFEIESVEIQVLNEYGEVVTLPEDEMQKIEDYINNNAEPDFD